LSEWLYAYSLADSLSQIHIPNTDFFEWTLNTKDESYLSLDDFKWHDYFYFAAPTEKPLSLHRKVAIGHTNTHKERPLNWQMDFNYYQNDMYEHLCFRIVQVPISGNETSSDVNTTILKKWKENWP